MMNKKLFAVLGTAMAVLFGGFSSEASVKNPVAQTYPTAGVVVALDEATDLVTFSTASGLLYEFYGIEDLEVGDIVAATMDDNGTPDNVLDDKVIDTKYAGWADRFNEIELEAAEHQCE